MRLRPIILGLIATAAACEAGKLDDGTAGTAGTGTTGVGTTAGTAGVGGFVAGDAGAGWIDTGGTSGGAIGGSSGTGGTGGSGSLPACDGSGGGSADGVELAIAGPDNLLVTSAVSASVKVTAIDNCGGGLTDIVAPGGTTWVNISREETRFVLTAADSRTWTLYLRDSAMPGDLVKVNDTFDMTVQASLSQDPYPLLNQTIVLAHGTDLVLFASALGGLSVPALPALDAFGIALTDAGALCELPPYDCVNRPHAVHVTVGTDSADVSGGTAEIGWLSFTNGGFLERPRDPSTTDACISRGGTAMAGFRTP